VARRGRAVSMVSDLHRHPPMTLARLRARHAWILPVVALVFTALGIAARFNTLPWDKPVFNCLISVRSAWTAGCVAMSAPSSTAFEKAVVSTKPPMVDNPAFAARASAAALPPVSSRAIACSSPRATTRGGSAMGRYAIRRRRLTPCHGA
jgi:hypothetical protein